MDYLKKIIVDFETHSAAGISECFQEGVDPNMFYKGKPLIYELINMYLRGPGFKNCIKAFVEAGLDFEDTALLAVLLDDAAKLDQLLIGNKEILGNKYSLACAFTPLHDASLLHICAEYNHVQCAEVLVNHGMDINIKAGVDGDGFGGQTPIFHTVNQHDNACLGVLKFLVNKQCDLLFTVRGLIWGKGYEWETFIPSVNPISYAMMGLLPQFQRKEEDIYEVVSILVNAAYGKAYTPPNVPNKYLKSDG